MSDHCTFLGRQHPAVATRETSLNPCVDSACDTSNGVNYDFMKQVTQIHLAAILDVTADSTFSPTTQIPADCTLAVVDAVDGCGVCGGSGASCAGCDGVVNSGLRMNSCGMCDEPESSCRSNDQSMTYPTHVVPLQPTHTCCSACSPAAAGPHIPWPQSRTHGSIWEHCDERCERSSSPRTCALGCHHRPCSWLNTRTQQPTFLLSVSSHNVAILAAGCVPAVCLTRNHCSC